MDVRAVEQGLPPERADPVPALGDHVSGAVGHGGIRTEAGCEPLWVTRIEGVDLLLHDVYRVHGNAVRLLLGDPGCAHVGLLFCWRTRFGTLLRALRAVPM